jgi:hypothetical protein
VSNTSPQRYLENTNDLSCGCSCSAQSRSKKYCDACKIKRCVYCGSSFRARLYTQRFCSQECQREDLWISNATGRQCRCGICGRAFDSHAALAGHMCSHKKAELQKNSVPHCRRCSVRLTDSNWPAYYRKLNRKQHICRECAVADKKVSNLRNRESRLARISNKRKALKLHVISMYGGCCACCGEDNTWFLTIDHIHNDGNKHRQEETGGGGHSMYTWLEKNKFPSGIVQVLCWNCNLGRHLNGGECPHTTSPRHVQKNAGKPKKSS